jgi:hypothetical protein
MAGWYVGFTCVVCGSPIPVIRSNARDGAEISLDPMNVMCPACGTTKCYDPADAHRFCADGTTASGAT